MDEATVSKSYDGQFQFVSLVQDKQTSSVDDLSIFVHGSIMMLMMASKGIKKHGQRAVDALFVNCASSMTRMFLILYMHQH